MLFTSIVLSIGFFSRTISANEQPALFRLDHQLDGSLF